MTPEPLALPQPPPFSGRNAARVLGPGALLLALSLGAGQWVIGPAVVATHGPAVLWVGTAGLLLQTLLVQEMGRYTLATGTPAHAGILHAPPGPAFWGAIHLGLLTLEMGWGGWALGAAALSTTALLGRPPRTDEGGLVVAVGVAVLLAAMLAAFAGPRLHRALGRAEQVLAIILPLLLIGLAVAVVPGLVGRDVTVGLLVPITTSPVWPQRPDWILLCALAAYAGGGGAAALTMAQWLSAKGFGMAGTRAAEPLLVAGRVLHRAPEARAFEPSEDNQLKWRQWWRYLRFFLISIRLPASLLTLTLPALLAAAVVTAETPVDVLVLVRALGERFGLAAALLALLTGFWALFATQLNVVEGFARIAADVIERAGGPAAGARPRRLYFALVGLLGGAGVLAITVVGDALWLIQAGAVVAALHLALLAAQVLWLGSRLLPTAARPSRWRRGGLALTTVFFGALFCLALWP